MLPLPFESFVPKLIRENPTDDSTAMINAVQTYLELIRDEVLELCHLYDPARVPVSILDELGYMLNAGFQATDSERTRREKLAFAIQGHKRRGSWSQDAKPKIDAIVGGDASLFSVALATDDDSIVLGNQASDPDTYWSVFGTDGVDLNAGIAVIGSGIELVLAGIVYIDVDSSTLTDDDIERLKLELEDIAPAYYRVFLGYVSAGDFVFYPNGELT